MLSCLRSLTWLHKLSRSTSFDCNCSTRKLVKVVNFCSKSFGVTTGNANSVNCVMRDTKWSGASIGASSSSSLGDTYIVPSLVWSLMCSVRKLVRSNKALNAASGAFGFNVVGIFNSRRLTSWRIFSVNTNPVLFTLSVRSSVQALIESSNSKSLIFAPLEA